MPVALVTVFPLVMAGVLIASGVAKLRRPDDLASWAELGVPAWLRQRWLLALHPWGEIALGVALAVFGGLLGTIAAMVALLLMIAYVVLVARAVGRGEDASCACFGTRKSVSAVTVWRNAWLTLVAAGAVALTWLLPLWGGAVLVAWWAGLAVLAIVAVTVALVMWPEPEARGTADAAASGTALAEPAGSPGSAGDELDYIRTRTPAVPVTRADGRIVNLRDLARMRPQLLLAVSETCGSCIPVIERIGEWRARLPELEVRFLLRAEPDRSGLTDTAEPQTLHDPAGYVSASISDWATPTAVLLGVDGMLAGGPVTGEEAIAAFVEDVHEVLHSEDEAR